MPQRAVSLDWRAAQLEMSAPPAAPSAAQPLLSPRDVVLAALTGTAVEAAAFCADGVVVPRAADVKVVEIAPRTDGESCVVEAGFVSDESNALSALTLELELMGGAWRICGVLERGAAASADFVKGNLV